MKTMAIYTASTMSLVPLDLFEFIVTMAIYTVQNMLFASVDVYRYLIRNHVDRFKHYVLNILINSKDFL